MIVVDASALLEFLLQTPLGSRVEARLVRDPNEWHAPELIDIEVLHGLRRLRDDFWDVSLRYKGEFHGVKIAAGQTVTWASSTTHPLIAMGGDSGTPIPTTATTTAASVTFPNAGTFGFWCNVHTSLMEGAIQVVAQ